jgi:hypothetical protein
VIEESETVVGQYTEGVGGGIMGLRAPAKPTKIGHREGPAADLHRDFIGGGRKRSTSVMSPGR